MSRGRFPNLFIIGAMKAGTSSLHEYLHQHPEIFMSRFKEPQYFAPHVTREGLAWGQGHQHPEPGIGHGDYAHVGLYGAEGIVRGGDAGLCQRIEKRGLSDVRQADYAAFDAHGEFRNKWGPAAGRRNMQIRLRATWGYATVSSRR